MSTALLDPITHIEALGDDHVMTSAQTPLRPDAFDLSDGEKMVQIAEHFRAIMEVMGLDLNDDSLSGTPYRVAKMYIQEIFSGLHPDQKPKISVFDNSYQYQKMLVEANIQFYSTCEHHFLPIIGKAHIGYVSNGKVIGLSKLNRIVDYYARRPQVQERLVMQIYHELCEVLDTEDVIVVMEAEHLCVSSRGIKDSSSFTSTLHYSGTFNNADVRNDFFKLVYRKDV